MAKTPKGSYGEANILEWVLRVGVAGCFIGHGAFGIIGKEGWLPYFSVVGIPESWAWVLMPVVGTVDIAVGVLALVSPRPWALAYMTVWAVWTALLRPLAGESAFETLERAGNYGLPLAFLVAVGFTVSRARPRDWSARVRVSPLSPERRSRLDAVLRGTIALLLVGHGGLAVGGKTLLVEHAAAVGVGPAGLAVFGWGEILLGMMVLARPTIPVLLAALLVKLGAEALYPLTGAPVWEFVERAGSYAAPLALMVLRGSRAPAARRSAVPGSVRAPALVLCLAGGAATWATVIPGEASAQQRPAPAGATATDVLERLRGGGLILACRHAHTDRSRGDRRPVNLDDPSTQRVLSEEGRQQARRLGGALRDLAIPIGEVLTSPYARTRNSAELGFGRSVRSDALMFGDRREQRVERRRLLSEPPTSGNRVLMTHQGVLYSSIPGLERGSVREGDCVVVSPRSGDPFRVLGRFGPDEFTDMLQAAPRPSRPPLPSRDLHTLFTGRSPRSPGLTQITALPVPKTASGPERELRARGR